MIISIDGFIFYDMCQKNRRITCGDTSAYRNKQNKIEPFHTNKNIDQANFIYLILVSLFFIHNEILTIIIIWTNYIIRFINIFKSYKNIIF